jgi:hypothetical protein
MSAAAKIALASNGPDLSLEIAGVTAAPLLTDAEVHP